MTSTELDHLMAYPFDLPGTSFVWSAGTRNRCSGAVEDLMRDRIPVLAIGANAAPSRLDVKFAEARFRDPELADSTIPVLRASAANVEVVYAAHLARYGSIPATVAAAPGVVSHVFVTWLTIPQFHHMNETEGLGQRYLLHAVPGVTCLGRELAVAYCYASAAGATTSKTQGGVCSPVGLAVIRAELSRLPRLDQAQMWDLVARGSGLADDGGSLAARVIANDDARAAVAAFLTRQAVPTVLAPASPTDVVASVAARAAGP